MKITQGYLRANNPRPNESHLTEEKQVYLRSRNKRCWYELDFNLFYHGEEENVLPPDLRNKIFSCSTNSPAADKLNKMEGEATWDYKWEVDDDIPLIVMRGGHFKRFPNSLSIIVQGREINRMIPDFSLPKRKVYSGRFIGYQQNYDYDACYEQFKVEVNEELIRLRLGKFFGNERCATVTRDGKLLVRRHNELVYSW